MKVIIANNSLEASKMVSDLIKEEIKNKNDSVIGLATGSTPIKVYSNLIENYKNGEIDFSETITFNLDEYIDLEKENKNSYYSFMNKNLFDHINIDKNNTYIPNGNSKDLEKECKDYDRKIDEKGGIDLQLLGIGRNGHIAFNEPGSDFELKTRIVDLSYETIKDNSRNFENIDDMPKKAITMGIASIMKAKKIILLALGESKKDALEKLICGEVDKNLPASILQKHSNVYIIADKEAGGNLTCLD